MKNLNLLTPTTLAELFLKLDSMITEGKQNIEITVICKMKDDVMQAGINNCGSDFFEMIK